MTELSFLVSLLLEHKLPKATREAVAARIKEVEGAMAYAPQPPRSLAAAPAIQGPIPAHMVGQPASTIAAMMRHEQAGGVPTPPAPGVAAMPAAAAPVEPPPVAQIAQTAAAAQAMAKRQEALSIGISGKPAKGELGPRKW